MNDSTPYPTMGQPSNFDIYEANAACHHSGQGNTAGDEVRWRDGSMDLSFPPVPMPSARVFKFVGESILRELVRRHHERLVQSKISHLFVMSESQFQSLIEKAADFMVELVGGPTHYSDYSEHTCMRVKHFPITIDEGSRDIWLAQLLAAFNDVRFPREMRHEVWDWLEAMSIRMINRRTTRAQPRRYPYIDASDALRAHMVTARSPATCRR